MIIGERSGTWVVRKNANNPYDARIKPRLRKSLMISLAAKVARIWHGATFSEFGDDPGLNEHGPLTAAKLAKLADYRRLVSIVAERLRPFLQDRKVRSFLFNRQLRNFFQKVPCEYWADPESAGMLMRLFFEEFEIRSSSSQPVPVAGVTLTARVHCITSTSRVSGLTGATPLAQGQCSGG
jgi:hypothetical protein